MLSKAGMNGIRHLLMKIPVGLLAIHYKLIEIAGVVIWNDF